MSSTLTSTPSNPASVQRQIGPLFLRLTAEGLTIHGCDGGPVTLSIDAALALSDFMRGPGARALIARAWLAEQHAAEVAETS